MEELDGPAVSALSVQSWNLSTFQWPVIGWVTKNLLSRAPPCFERHVKPFVTAAFAIVPTPVSRLTSGRRPVVKIIAESLSQHDEKQVVPTPLSGIRVGRKRTALKQ
jgi:hypothetical protein